MLTPSLIRTSLMTFGALLFGQFVLTAAEPEPLDVEPEELLPGLVAEYRSLVDPQATLLRIDSKPALLWGESSPHPRIPEGPVELTWTGAIRLRDPGPIKFSAYVCGDLVVEIGGKPMLSGSGESISSQVGPGDAFDGEPGLYPFLVQYRSKPGQPARLQLWWQGPTFSSEPVPAWHLFHLLPANDDPIVAALEVQQGRETARRMACRQCHASAFPGLESRAAGPSLNHIEQRLDRNWLLDWLDDPARVRPDTAMPGLFAPTRQGLIERWILTEYLTPGASTRNTGVEPAGNHRMGRRHFVDVGCAACHLLPDMPIEEQLALGQRPFAALGARWTADSLADFLVSPHQRYADGRMPAIRLTPEESRDMVAYLLLWLGKETGASRTVNAPTDAELKAELTRRRVNDVREAGAMIWREKQCAACHVRDGVDLAVGDVPIRSERTNHGCLAPAGDDRSVQFAWTDARRSELRAYLAQASLERHSSPVESRRQQIESRGCLRCHQRDSDRPPPIEQIGAKLGGAWLQHVPYQRTPRLTHPHLKFYASHLLQAVRDGVSGIRDPKYSYRMPVFGDVAAELVQALAEQDGDVPVESVHDATAQVDPTAAPQFGPQLVGFQGYGCVSCHIWKGQKLADPDPGAIGPDLTRVAERIQRPWLDRLLENPLRVHPGTPMPAIFSHGQPATLRHVLDGDANRQREILWQYLKLGANAPGPKPPAPLPITEPRAHEPAIVAQIPVRLDQQLVEGLCILTESHDLLVYDLGLGAARDMFSGAQILRQIQGRLRSYSASGTRWGTGLLPAEKSTWSFRRTGREPVSPAARTLRGYDRLSDGARLRWAIHVDGVTLEIAETVRLVNEPSRDWVQSWEVESVPADATLTWRTQLPAAVEPHASADKGTCRGPTVGEPSADARPWTLELAPDASGKISATWRVTLPAAVAAPAYERPTLVDTGRPAGSRERPGYRAIEYPRPATVSGEDLIMPGAISVDPVTGRVFVASMKLGELFVLDDPHGDGRDARFIDYTRGLFQEAYSMKAERDGLYVLHRRNLTRIQDTDQDGVADRFDRVAPLAHGIGEQYDYAYGLVRDRSGSFVISYAPYANTSLAGSGSAIRLAPGGGSPEEIAFGFRNPVGWSEGPRGEIFYTDNQGEWVATNKLCHIVPGQYYGFPNQAQKQHITRPFAKTSVWIPYSWARSINGVTYDSTGGKFGPFAGQFFLAELMFGGAIIRAQVEEVNGVYQGACFPFWGEGLLGPLTLAFSPNGPLYVGSITEPGWMAQPDRGALFRIDYTQEIPFEIQSIHVQPRGFRLVFTRPVSLDTARLPAAYQLERYRYEYTSAYGSPELNRGPVSVEAIRLAPDGRSVELRTEQLLTDHVYLITARGVRSSSGEPLVHPTGAYTLHELP